MHDEPVFQEREVKIEGLSIRVSDWALDNFIRLGFNVLREAVDVVEEGGWAHVALALPAQKDSLAIRQTSPGIHKN